jgi:hypothetical protein
MYALKPGTRIRMGKRIWFEMGEADPEAPTRPGRHYPECRETCAGRGCER